MSAVPATNGFLVPAGALSRDSLQPTSTGQTLNGSAIGAGRVHDAAAAALPSSAPMTALSLMLGTNTLAAALNNTVTGSSSSGGESEQFTLDDLPDDSPRTLMSKRMARLPPCTGVATPGVTPSASTIHVNGRSRRQKAVTPAPFPGISNGVAAAVAPMPKPQPLPAAPALSMGDQILNGFRSIFRCKCSS
jgi:hypothetical protein